MLLLVSSAFLSLMLIYQIDENVQKLGLVEGPLEEAALELKINAGEGARAIILYSIDKQAVHVDRLKDSDAGFKRSMKEFLRLAETDEQRTSAIKVANLHDGLQELGVRIIDNVDRGEPIILQLRNDVVEIDEVIDQRLQPLVNRNDPMSLSKLEAVLEMEINIDEAFAAIQIYIDRPSPELRQVVLDSEQGFEKFENVYRDSSLSTEENQWMKIIDGDFQEAVALGESAMDLADEKRSLIWQLEASVDAIDRVVVEDIHPRIRAESAKALEDAKSSSNSAVLVTGIFALLGILIGVATMMIVGRNILNPIVRLRNASIELGAGDLSVRTDIKSRDEIGDLANSFNQMAEAREEAVIRERRSAEENSVLAEIGRVVTESSEISKIYDPLAQEIQKLITHDRIAINTVDLATGTFVRDVKGLDAPGRRPDEAAPLSGSFTEAIVNSNSAMLIQPDNIDELSQQIPGLVPVYKAGARSFIGVPLVSRNEIIGALHINSINENNYDERDLSLALRIANQISGALSNARLYRQNRLVEAQREALIVELERSNQELDQFAHIASHDLQEPLRMVASYTQLLARRYKDKLDSDANDFIAFAVDGAKRMQAQINDLLAFSRITTQVVEYDSANCQDIFDMAISNLAGSIKESGAVVTRDSLPTVQADASQLVSVFQNIIGNGIKYHGADSPCIHVSAVESGDKWLFPISDNGIGIEAEFAERIFVIFQRLHGKSEYSGTGIGLAICKKVVDRHGGRIWVESEPQKGSTFWFTLPMG